MKIQKLHTTTLVEYFTNIANKYEKYNLLLSGGHTPYSFYELLSKNKFNFPKNSILTDDRIEGNNSNEIMLSQSGILTTLKNNSNYTQILKYKRPVRNAKRVNKTLNKNYKDNNICLIGMGLNGHIAGIMPNSSALDSKEYFIYANNKQGNLERLTITKTFLVEKVTETILIIGKEKYNAFEKFYEDKQSPTNILQKVKNLSVVVLETS